MAARPSALLDDLDTALVALAPIRRRILSALIEPASAAGLADQLGLPRQNIGYHLNALEAAGLVRLAGERRKRGFTERLFVAARNPVLDPALLQAPPHPDAVDAQDRHAADHLIAAASTLVRDVARMRQAADAEGSRLLTLTVEADVGFATPADFDAFTEDVSAAVAALARKYAAPSGRRYRLTAVAHPAAPDRPAALKN
ncbi:MAG: helix-turn-helix domain-containing protein [Alphaproteobacteria bacterium]|jgi:DNA-binding transcriptional ArsR family regulator|nr:helix-turn-helix domain-containing protein [Alphaproteobacteria bacterium]MBU2042608.1 helix-turn-helix domain-containing protein [Alphaproteobacteria bacterium]MBU2124889.1 helix-turn-helix domain-containing protein [Alphaproteobacteria bacterium]MBU2209654.1 helix-turn-helix domain-containing protein [Alphaproteobacteria bacterium]MBU2291782.1 helix-turn-helix domain-containing protein [Alphaproteobacteria bacterium]